MVDYKLPNFPLKIGMGHQAGIFSIKLGMGHQAFSNGKCKLCDFVQFQKLIRNGNSLKG